MKIIIVSHGTFAQAMKDTARMIVGEVQDVYAFGIVSGEKLELFDEKIETVLREAKEKGEEVFVFSDMFFGTPFNTMVRLMKTYDVYHYTGISMPVLLECLTLKDSMNAEELKAHIEEISTDTFMNVNEFFKNCEE